jgi:CRP-like cAMP-binding protein
LPPGGWLGEGTVIKREAYRYNIEALRKSVVAGLGVETFHWLLDRSIPFNRFIVQQLNERLGQFIAAREIDRLNDPDARVARSLAALFTRFSIRASAPCCGSRSSSSAIWSVCHGQRVNQALHELAAHGAIRIEYGGVSVLDLEKLRGYGRP